MFGLGDCLEEEGLLFSARPAAAEAGVTVRPLATSWSPMAATALAAALSWLIPLVAAATAAAAAAAAAALLLLFVLL